MFKINPSLDTVLTKEFLYSQYVVKKLAIGQIAKMIPCNFHAVELRLLRFGIPKRNMKEACALRPPHSEETKIKLTASSFWRGKHLPIKIKAKIGKFHKGNKWAKGFKYPTKVKSRMGLLRRGKPCPWIKGSKHPRWKGGISSLRVDIYGLLAYKIWRTTIFIRDNCTCQDCGKLESKETKIESHHLKHFRILFAEFLSTYPQYDPIKDKEKLLSLAKIYAPFWDPSNGITVCSKCHKLRHK